MAEGSAVGALVGYPLGAILLLTGLVRAYQGFAAGDSAVGVAGALLLAAGLLMMPATGREVSAFAGIRSPAERVLFVVLLWVGGAYLHSAAA